ncbi:DUF1045 domain-containing protein [uncultured Marivita sp.]|uniref:DUF1045 domain-containing protein n=1 Tax=uncultured Marivita sp. TaxID=888080 RepID=UPI0026342E06|nr:DUF1045 domain-containing protein [uncultured Marivita sp.]
MSHRRYAIYYVPPSGVFARFGAEWLGWDIDTGKTTSQPDLPGLAQITERPRRYGFHATLKPPFRLADGADIRQLRDAVAEVACDVAPASCDGLELSRLGRFLALTAVGDAAAVSQVASDCVAKLDGFRAASTEAELAARQKSRLSDRQQRTLERWGYPYVMEDFRFHMTLTGQLPKADIAFWTETLRARMPDLPSPFVLDAITLVGEREDGHFEVIQRYPLTG